VELHAGWLCCRCRARSFRGIRSCTPQTLLSLLVLLAGVVSVRYAHARPIERFDGAIDRSCQSSEPCGVSSRSDGSLAGRLGLVVSGIQRGKTRLRTRGDKTGRVLELQVPATGVGVVTLSWDADPHPHQLSSAGLGCLNLREDGAFGLRIEPFEVRTECSGSPSNEGCKPIWVESRIYDPSDPTGQRYSASILRVKVPRRGTSLDVPFSNFIHQGPRGGASFECVGALSIAIKIEGQGALSMEVGSITTFGYTTAVDITPLPVVREPTRAVPTSTPVERSTPVSTSTPSSRPSMHPTTAPTASPTKSPTASPTRTVAVSPTGAPLATKVPSAVPVPTEPSTPHPTATPAATTQAHESPLPAATAQVVQSPAQETVLGAVLATAVPPQPSRAPRKRRNLWE